jgi:hypothetical protein
MVEVSEGRKEIDEDKHTVMRPNIVLTNSLSEARFSRISRSVERFMRIVSASLAICWGDS